MGLSGISPWSLLLILLIVVLLFGTKRLRHIGKDLGGAVKSFRSGLNDQSEDTTHKHSSEDTDQSHQNKS